MSLEFSFEAPRLAIISGSVEPGGIKEVGEGLLPGGNITGRLILECLESPFVGIVKITDGASGELREVHPGITLKMPDFKLDGVVPTGTLTVSVAST